MERDGATTAPPRRTFRQSPVLRFAGAAVITAVALGTTACDAPKVSVSSSSSSSSSNKTQKVDDDTIPGKALGAYKSAANKFGCSGIDAALLAGVGWRETKHGLLKADGVAKGESSAHAAGPVQFIPKTWRWVAPKVGASKSLSARYSWKDSTNAAAWYLCYEKRRSGSVWGALNNYSGGTGGYATAVQNKASKYRSSDAFHKSASASKSKPFEWPKAPKSKSKSKVKPFKWAEPAKPKKSTTKTNSASKGSPAKKVAMKDSRGKRVGTAEVSVLDSVFGRCGITVVVPGATDVRVKAVGQDPRLVRTQSWTNSGKTNFAPQHDSDGLIVLTAKINGKSAKADSLHLSLSKAAVGIGSSNVAC